MKPVTRGAMQGPRCQTRHPGPAATKRSHRDCGWRTRSTARPGSNPSFLPHTTRFPRPRMAIVNRPEARPDDKQARLKAAYSRATHAVSPKSCPYRAGNRIYNFLILRITANDEQATFVRIRSPASGAARCRIAAGSRTAAALKRQVIVSTLLCHAARLMTTDPYGALRHKRRLAAASV
jgi:hypothetical protein